MKIERLIAKYDRKRAKYYQEALKAQRRNDMEGQVIYAAFQLAYTEMSSDLRALTGPGKTK